MRIHRKTHGMSQPFFVCNTKGISLRFHLNTSDWHLEHECEGRLYRSDVPVGSAEFRKLLMSTATRRRIQGMYSVANKPFEFMIAFDGADAHFFRKIETAPNQACRVYL